MLERLTETRIGAIPWARHSAFCLQASRRTHSPMGTISPVSSAIGMNCAGETSPKVGWFQRTSASIPFMAPESMSTRG